MEIYSNSRVPITSHHLLDVAESLTAIAEKSGDLRFAYYRKAISTAYYALFHKLIEDATHRFVGPNDEHCANRDELARWYTHGDIRTVSKWIVDKYRGKSLPDPVQKFMRDPSKELATLAKLVIYLQQARHNADYDHIEKFDKDDAEALLDGAQQAISLTYRLRDDPNYDIYLKLLLGGPKIARKAA